MQQETRLVHVARDPLRDSGAVNPPVYRASVIVYPSLQAFSTRRGRRYTSFSGVTHEAAKLISCTWR